MVDSLKPSDQVLAQHQHQQYLSSSIPPPNNHNQTNTFIQDDQNSPTSAANQYTKNQSLYLQSNLKELKDNYHAIEFQIHSETIKQRDYQRERYAMVLDRIQSMKKLLKIEIEQRKNAENIFKEKIERRSNEILEKYTAEYLNKLSETSDKLKSFKQRKATLDQNIIDLKEKVDEDLRDHRFEILKQVGQQRSNFDDAYKQSIHFDLCNLKAIGELQHNFEQMTCKMFAQRSKEFDLIQEQIATALDNQNIYEKETATKKMLLNQVNELKMACKVEIDSRKAADDEISAALDQYSSIIEQEVVKKRAEVLIKHSDRPITQEVSGGGGFAATNQVHNANNTMIQNNSAINY